MQKEKPKPIGKPSLTAAYVKQRILHLQQSGNESQVKASLAKLRRGIGKAPGSQPDIWEDTIGRLPESLQGEYNKPNYAEWASHLAITLFAFHQQSRDPKEKSMHKDGETLGRAVRKLVTSPEDEARVKRRFDQVATADSQEELAHHLRGLISLLRAGEIPLDYAALTRDLYLYQIEGERDSVRLRWGRDFYFGVKDEDNKSTIENKNENETEEEELEGEPENEE